MTPNRNPLLGTAVTAMLFGALLGHGVRAQRASPPGRGVTGQTPTFEVDPLWPKPLPNHWILGSVTGVAVDRQDHIWIVHRGVESLNTRTEAGLVTNPPSAEDCCLPAPPVLAFDRAGNLVGHWGGPGQGYDWPDSPAGITVDAKDNVWIAAAGIDPAGSRGRAASAADAASASQGRATAAGSQRPQDAHILGFSRAGQFVRQIGRAGTVGSSDSTTGLNRPSSLDVDEATHEIYVADGPANHRVVVFDAGTGTYKRHWGAYGAAPDGANLGPYDPSAPPARQFRRVTCVRIAKDGMVYVCDRENDRIQVFRKDGTFVKEAFISRTTTGDGSVWDIAFSSDPPQRFLYVADGHDEKVFILQRESLEVVTSFGDGGRWPGQFYGVGHIAVDSNGNIYTGEAYEGKRIQKFLKK